MYIFIVDSDMDNLGEKIEITLLNNLKLFETTRNQIR